MWSFLWSSLVSKIPKFLVKNKIWAADHAFLESKHPEDTENLYYV